MDYLESYYGGNTFGALAIIMGDSERSRLEYETDRREDRGQEVEE